MKVNVKKKKKKVNASDQNPYILLLIKQMIVLLFEIWFSWEEKTVEFL